MQDEAWFARPSCLPGVELVSVAYHERAFPQHSREEWLVGAVMTGGETLVVDRTSYEVSSGQILRLHPDQSHSNCTSGRDVLRYRVAYIADKAIAPFVNDTIRRRRFTAPVVTDIRTHAAIANAHAALSNKTAGCLEQESALTVLASAMFEDMSHDPLSTGCDTDAIAAVRAYIDAHFTEGFGLGTLSLIAGISISHLARSFRAATGLTPLAYRNQRRIVAAKRLLVAGPPIARTALEVGYADQSHLTRQFQRIVGVSPGRYIRG